MLKLFLALVVSAAALFATALRPLSCQDYPSEIHYRFEEGTGRDVIDSVSGLSHGELHGGTDFSSLTAGLSSGIENRYSIEIRRGWARIGEVPFVFNRNGASGDASLEWLMYISAEDYGSIFWSNGDSEVNENRFNFVTVSGSLGAVFVAEATSTPHDAIATSPLAPPTNTWMAVTVVRKNLGGGSFEWNTYVDGVRNADHASTTSGPLPVAESWIIGGEYRGNRSFAGLIDEVRIVDRVLSENELIAVEEKPCPNVGDPEFADATCEELHIQPSSDGPRMLEGWFFVSATGVDRSDDPLLHVVLRAESDSGDRLEVGPQRKSGASFRLRAGTWTITAIFDDDLVCDDDAPEAVCSETIEVGRREGVGPFLRGDCDDNSVGGPTEAVILLNFLFRDRSRPPPCLAACDAEADGVLYITDAIRILRHAYLGIGEPDAPYPNCVKSDKETDVELGCEQPLVCAW